jgi:metal-responsive CopG/Arc/MetJ family transcriptional regulator
MKMTISIPDVLFNEITEISKYTGYTKSGLVSTALNIYFLLYHADNKKAEQLANLIPDNQTTIYEFLKDKQQKQNIEPIDQKLKNFTKRVFEVQDKAVPLNHKFGPKTKG